MAMKLWKRDIAVVLYVILGIAACGALGAMQ